MKRLLAVTGLVSFAMLTGCVPQERYNALRMQNQENLAARDAAERRAAAAEAEAQALKSQSAMGGQGMDAALAQIKSKDDQLALKQKELDALNARYAELMANAGKMSALPAPLASELKEFAAANPDLIEFDEARGIVKFKSDVTFDLGDATLKPKAKEVLQKFASILNANGAKNYELLVAGHTDSVPVNNPATIAKGHKNNWYLSAHRAISVADELIAQKVSPARIGAVGYADQRPVSSNATPNGQAANRRVEVLILPTQVKASAPAAAPVAPKPAGNGNKDSGATTPPPAAPTDNK